MCVKTNTITMMNWPFLHYWLYAAFPHCYGLRRHLFRHFPYSREWIDQMFFVANDQEIEPIIQTITIDKEVITILLYRYHVEYRMDNRELLLYRYHIEHKMDNHELFHPRIPYHMVENLDDETFLLLLPIVDMFDIEYNTSKLMSDLIQRLSRTALPKEHIEEIAYVLSVGLTAADGAEDEPLWIIWQETADNLYGAEWWPDEGKFRLFQQPNIDCDHWPEVYLTAPESTDYFSYGKQILSQWISSLF